jgi:hypothetical protein
MQGGLSMSFPLKNNEISKLPLESKKKKLRLVSRVSWSFSFGFVVIF